jgi:hypothetical protein
MIKKNPSNKPAPPRGDGTSSRAVSGKCKRFADVPMPSADQPFLTRLEAYRLMRIGSDVRQGGEEEAHQGALERHPHDCGTC